MAPQTMSFSDGLIQVLVAVAPSFVVLCIVFIVFSWLRVVVDNMSGRGL